MRKKESESDLRIPPGAEQKGKKRRAGRAWAKVATRAVSWAGLLLLRVHGEKEKLWRMEEEGGEAAGGAQGVEVLGEMDHSPVLGRRP